MTQQYYSVDQVAELLGLHVKTVRAYVREGRLEEATQNPHVGSSSAPPVIASPS
jgi:DNA-directed RNA polymerase specialized sigma24 family protein